MQWVKVKVGSPGEGRVVRGRGLVVDADDLAAALLSSVDKQLGFALLLDGHGRSIQHWGHKQKRRKMSRDTNLQVPPRTAWFMLLRS